MIRLIERHFLFRFVSAGALTALVLTLWNFSSEAYYVSLVLVWVLCWPRRTREIVLIAALVFVLFPTRAFEVTSPIGSPILMDVTLQWARLKGADLVGMNPLFLLIHTFVSLAGLFIAWFLISGAPPGIQRFAALISMSLLAGAVIFFDRISSVYTITGLVALSFIRVWGEILFSMLIIGNTIAIDGFGLADTWKMLPFWNAPIVPFWEFQPLSSSDELRANADKMRTRVVGLTLVFLALGALENRAVDLLFASGDSRPWLANDEFEGPSYFIKMVPSLGAAWMSIVLGTLHIIFRRLVLYVSVPTLILMYLGVPAKFNIQSPHRATTFHSFVSRIYYYYNRALVTIFLRPLLQRLRFLREYPKLRLFAAIFLSVEIFGFIQHFIRDYQTVLTVGVWLDLKEHCGGDFAFLTLLALSTGFSSILVPRREWLESRPVHRAGLCVFFVIYLSVLYLIATNYFTSTLTDRLAMIKFLFTGSR